MDMETFPNGTQTLNYQHKKNPKQVKYLGDAKLSGYDPNSTVQPLGGVDINGIYRDPWGNPYIITMNTSYNEAGTSDLILFVGSSFPRWRRHLGILRIIQHQHRQSYTVSYFTAKSWSGPPGRIKILIQASKPTSGSTRTIS